MLVLLSCHASVITKPFSLAERVSGTKRGIDCQLINKRISTVQCSSKTVACEQCHAVKETDSARKCQGMYV